MLPSITPRARILRFAYESQWLGREAIQQRLPLVADQLLHCLLEVRKICPSRPLIFIGHCFGGLVIQKAVVSAKLHASHYPGICDSVSGVIFLGTPNRGSNSQSKAAIIASVAEATGFGEYSSLLRTVEKDSDMLKDLLHDFTRLANVETIPLVCFFEQHKSNIAKTVTPKSMRWLAQMETVVDEESACVDGFPKLGLATDHFNMNKFTGPDDAGYNMVRSEVSRIAVAAPARRVARMVGPTSDPARESVEQKDKECLSALFLTDPEEDMTIIETKTDKLIKDSNTWVLSHGSFTNWLNDSGQHMLWIHGDPGKGKTFIAISLVRELGMKLQHQGSSNTHLLLYFFCDNKDHRRNTGIAILRGLLYQLFSQRPDLCYMLRLEFEKRRNSLLNSPSTLHTLWRILQNTIANEHSLNVYIIIDALDECQDDSVADLLTLIAGSKASEEELYDGGEEEAKTPIKWIMTSRNVESLRQEMYNALDIDLEQSSEKVANSVAHFITSRVAHLTKAKRYPASLALEVQRVLRERAEGTFLWVALACRELAKPKVRSINTKSVLEKLPAGLTPLYDRILEQILDVDDQYFAEQAKKVLKVMAVALRPLTIWEIAIVARLPAESLKDEQVLSDYLELCNSIVAVRNETAHFVHESAQEYLRRRSDIVPEDLSLAHTDVAHACFEHLCEDPPNIGQTDNEAEGSGEKVTSEHLEYPVMFWLEHARLGETHVEALIDVECGFLELQSESRQRWLDSYWCKKHWRWEAQPSEFEAIHLAAYGGLPWLILAVLDVRGQDQSSLQDSLGHDALMWAAIRGWDEAVKCLIEKHAAVVSKNKQGLTALYLAASNGHMAVVRALVEGGADVNCCDALGSTLLHCVTGHGHIDILRYLLDANAEVDARDHLKWTAVQRACSNGQLAAVKVFKERGADMMQKDREGMTLLHYAASHGHTDVATFLIKSGARIDTKCYEQWTALHEASWSGEDNVVAFLLKSGSDVTERTKEGHTALHSAAWNGHIACVKLLLEHGASVRDSCHEGETPLHQAAWRGHKEVVEQLLGAYSPVHAENGDGKTALDHAITSGNACIVDLLSARMMQELPTSPDRERKDSGTAESPTSGSLELPTKPLAFTVVHRNDMDPPIELETGIAKAIPGQPVYSNCHHHGHAGFSVPLKITARYADGTERRFFCKTYGNEPMFRSEHLSLKSLGDTMPTICPTPIVYGSMESTDHFFLLTEYLDAEPTIEVIGTGLTLAQKLARLHSEPVPIPAEYGKPMFGFPMTTYCGSTPQDNTYTDSWAYFFGQRRLAAIGRICEERHGADEDLRLWLDRTVDHVVPALLSDGHLGGTAGIHPSLVHGDLWMGNRAKGQVEGWYGVEEICFDPSSVYAHNEYEFAIMRLFGGFLASFWSQYHDVKPKTEPSEEYEDRVSLYSVYHLLNHYAMYSGGWRDDAIDVMKELWERYRCP